MNEHLRQQLIDTARRMASCGLNRGTAGNLSTRAQENGEPGFLITPTGMAYETLMPDDIVFMNHDGTPSGRRQPSSEWRFHRDIYIARAEAQAILHAHSPFATSLACLRRQIPAFHYMIARFGGDTLRCADYATFGTQALSDHALAAMAGRRACLLAHHGAIAIGVDLDAALALAGEVETLCEMYLRAAALGEPRLLPDDEMDRVIAKFASYGQD